MTEKYKDLMKNIGIFTIGNFASKILVFFLVPLYTSVLSSEEYGNYDIVVSTIQLLLPIITINIADAVMRFMMEKDANREAVVTIGIKYTFIASMIIMVMVLLLKKTHLFSKYVDEYWYLIALYFIFYMLQNFLPQIAKGVGKTIEIGIAGVLGTAVTVISNIIFLLVMKLGLKGFFLANIMGNAVPAFYYIVRLKVWKLVTWKKKENDLEKRMLRYSAPLILVGIGWSLNSSLDKYITTAICGLTANGLLAIAYKIPNILSVFQLIFNQAWSISAIKEYNTEESKEYYTTIITNVNMIITIASSFLIILVRPLAGIMYSNEFYNAWSYVPFLLVSSTFNLVAGFLGPILAAEKNSKAMGKSALYGIAVNVVFNYVLIMILGVLGATMATAMSSFVIYWVRRLAAKNMINDSFDGVIYRSWGLMIVLACVEIWMQNYWIEVGIFILILFLYRKMFGMYISYAKKLLATRKK